MDFQPLFVGGGWRGGTTVLHALVCTSPRTNDFLNECSYFYYLTNAYILGANQFQGHSRFYFRDMDHMKEVHAQILRNELNRTWEWLGKPQILALKSPPLTLHFPLLAEIFPTSRFVVSIRDPRDVVASRVQVVRKQNANANIEQVVRGECQAYKEMYNRLLAGNLGDRLCTVSYEDLVAGDFGALRRFGLDDIEPARLWQGEIAEVKRVGEQGDTWLTSLHGGPLSASSVGRYKEVLSDAMQELVINQCGEVADRFRALANK